MKEFTILTTATRVDSTNTAAYAVQAAGTLNERPYLVAGLRGSNKADALLKGMLAGLNDIKNYLREGDIVDLQVAGDASVLRSAAEPRTSATLREIASREMMNEFRETLARFRKTGVDVVFTEHAEAANGDRVKTLVSRAGMAATLGDLRAR
jgi:hypothetical protein